MLHKTSGIILHTTNYSDTSLIVKIYTEKFGLQSYMISGVRSKKSKTKASLFQPMALVSLEVSNSEKTTLQRISEINIEYQYTDVPYNIIKSSIAIFLNEVLFRTLKEEHPDEDLFSYIKNSFMILDLKTENCSNFHMYFLVQLSKFLGFYPQGDFSDTTSYFDLSGGIFLMNVPSHNNYLKPELSKSLAELMASNFEHIHNLKMDGVQRKMLLKALILYYQFHISSFGELKSMAVLEQVVG